MIRGDTDSSDAKYTSGLEPNPIVSAGGKIWKAFSERITQPELNEFWKRI